jgi:15-cis-phytoene synthase
VTTVEAAERYCMTVTRSRAGNFYYGIRLLPEDKRRALCAVYAFARRMDDVGDGTLPDAEKLALLTRARGDLADVSSRASDPVLAAVGHARERFDIPMDAFVDLIDGVEMDVVGATYDTFGDLERYCRRVAGSIGRLSVGVFGASDRGRAGGLADDLGVAMQLTNILRDLREDRARGRVYLPREDLDRFGCGPDPLRANGEAAKDLVRFECVRAGVWFERGLRLLPLLDARSASCVRAMTGIYRRILARLQREPEAALRVRVSLPPWEKAWVAARSLAGVSE